MLFILKKKKKKVLFIYICHVILTKYVLYVLFFFDLYITISGISLFFQLGFHFVWALNQHLPKNRWISPKQEAGL